MSLKYLGMVAMVAWKNLGLESIIGKKMRPLDSADLSELFHTQAAKIGEHARSDRAWNAADKAS